MVNQYLILFWLGVQHFLLFLENYLIRLDSQIQKRSMTVVARGAAVYATQFEVDSSIKEQVKDKTKIQLDLSYEIQS